MIASTEMTAYIFDFVDGLLLEDVMILVEQCQLRETRPKSTVARYDRRFATVRR